MSIAEPNESISLHTTKGKESVVQAVSGIMVAGGRSRRLGEDKRKLRLWGPNGPTLLEHTLEVLQPICTELIVVLNDPEDWRHLPVRLVSDVYADAGALGGIYSGLAAATSPYSIVVGADMPLLNQDVLRWMLAYPRDYDALVPRSPRPANVRNALDVEPLHAVYSRACLEPLRDTLEQGKRRIIDFFARVHVTIIEPREMAAHDPHSHSFMNINTVEELAEARRLISTIVK